MGLDRLGKKAPELRVEPAKVVAGAVTVPTNALAKALDFRDQAGAIQRLKIIIHIDLHKFVAREIFLC